MEVPCVTVRHIGDRWGVTQKGLDWFLAEFFSGRMPLTMRAGLHWPASNPS